MKIRTDFVTNSSSSSFCCIQISGSKLMEILKEYKELFEEEETVKINDDKFEYIEPESGYFEGPSCQEDISSSFQELIEEISEFSDDPDEFQELLLMIEDNEEEINKTITYLNWEKCTTGWGADDQSRYNHDYDDDFIRNHLGLEKDAKISEETKERFRQSLAEATSQKTTIWSYDGANFEIRSEFELL